jgi:4-hydroxybenzoate polyprenyltransferase/phosphoserine phosphatase
MDRHAPSDSDKTIVVCADVDGTILATDLLYESFIYAIKRHVRILFLVPFWLLRGRAFLKRKLAELAGHLDIGTLPLRAEVVAYLEMAAREGRRILLVSAADKSLVERLARRLDFSADVLASDGVTNCKGAAKAQRIEGYLKGQPWEYVGDSRADLAVWRRADRVVCASTRARIIQKVKSEFPSALFLRGEGSSAFPWIKALRVHQWMKNVLVFVPLVLAHKWMSVSGWLNAGCAAVALSLCASGVYVLNDLLDIESDRMHLRKRQRPFASGQLNILSGLIAIPLLFAAAFCVSWLVIPDFTLILGIYLLITTAYSYRLKALALVDILLLAILYTLRIIAGGVATGVNVSQWLICLSMFLFLSLACVKRFSELLLVKAQNEHRTWGRGYSVGDLEQIASFGSASGYIAALVMALYVSSKEISVLYAHPTVVWLAVPLLLYWISRIWLLARRGLVHDDPLVFALQDKVTYAVCLIGVLIFLGAKW